MSLQPHPSGGFGKWLQTARQWGNGRVLFGQSHFMVTTGGVEGDGLRALCGYVAHERTRMVPPRAGNRRCVRCLRAERLAVDQ